MKLSINTLDRKLPDNTVITAHWNAIIEDGEFSASSYGSQTFVRNEDSPEFVQFDDLTEEIVLSWLDLGEALEVNLLAQIEEQKNPTTAQSVPW
jgi:hypothetical protein